MRKKGYKFLVGIITLLMLNFNVNAQDNNLLNEFEGEWNFKPAESEVKFKIGNLFILNVKGEMPLKKGHLINNNDQFEVKVVIDPTSLETGINKRDDHLKSEDFFYVEKYPVIEFVGTQVLKNNNEKRDKYKYKTTGNLTIRSVTKEKEVYFNIEKISHTEILITGESKINRIEYNVDYDMAGMGEEAKVKFEVKAQITE